VPESLLTILKFCFLAVLYLFFLRVLRAVWADLDPRRAAMAVAAPPEAARAPRAAAGGGAFTLKIVDPADQRGRSFEIADEATVGRAAGCQLALDDSYVSQLHARVFRRDGQWFVEDLGSTNGTFVNRKKVTSPVRVRRGDRVQFGRTVLEAAR
jgi:pSer/pThr/pTyr-binding forkhead associated (FHA) protein